MRENKRKKRKRKVKDSLPSSTERHTLITDYRYKVKIHLERERERKERKIRQINGGKT